MDGLHSKNRLILAQLIVSILAISPDLEKIDFKRFSGKEDYGEGNVILSALSSSACLPNLKMFGCGDNNSWFSEEN